MNGSPAKLLGLWDICDDCIATTRGALWGGAEVYGVDPTGRTELGREQIAMGLYSNLAKMADGVFVQFVWVNRGLTKVEDAAGTQGQESEVFRYQRRRRKEFLAQKRMRRKKLYVFFSARQCLSVKEFRNVSHASHRAAVKEVEELERSLKATLRRSGIELQRLDDNSLFALMAEWMAPDGNPRKRWVNGIMPPREWLDSEPHLTPPSPREQLFRGEVSWESGHLKLGHTFIKVLACNQLPPQTQLNHLEKINWPSFDFRLVLNMYIPPKKVAEAVFRQQRRIANAFAVKKHGPVDTEAQEGLAGMNQLDRELVAGARLIKVGLQAVVTASTEKEVAEKANAIREAMSGEDFELYEETWAHDREFFKTMPGMAGDFDRWRLVTSYVASDLIPVDEYSAGDREPLLVFQNALSQEPFGYSMRERIRANDNWLVLGASGAGKSVLVNMLLAYQMLSGPYRGRIFAIDYAGREKSSFRTACEVFGGKYISIAGDGQKINPWKAKGEAFENGQLKPEVLNFLTQITNPLLYNVGISKQEALYESIIQRAITRVYERWEQDSAPTFRAMVSAFEEIKGEAGIEEDKRQELQQLLQKLLNEPGGRLLDTQSKIDSDGDFICYDLYGLKSYDPRIRGVVAAIAMHHVRELAFDGRPERYKYVCLEEVTNLFSLGLKGLVEELITTARAHGTSVGVVNQEYEAYRRSDVAGVINLCTTTKWLMSHKKAKNAMEPIIADMELNETEAKLLRGLQAVKGEFSELLLKTQCWSPDGGRDVTAKLRFELSPFDYQVVTSDAQDRARQLKLARKYPEADQVQILDYLAYPGRGALAGRRQNGDTDGDQNNKTALR